MAKDEPEDEGERFYAPPIPGPVAVRFLKLRRALETRAQQHGLELVAYDNLEESIVQNVWTWSMYGSGKQGPFCIQALLDGNAPEKLCFTLFAWLPCEEHGAEWVGLWEWRLADDRDLGNLMNEIRQAADEPIPEEEQPPKHGGLRLVP